jgi:hypothetical protein
MLAHGHHGGNRVAVGPSPRRSDSGSDIIWRICGCVISDIGEAASSTQAGGALVDERGPARRDELRGQESRMAGLSFLESVPTVASKLKEPNTKDEKFEDVVKSAQDAAVLVLVY